MATLLGLLCSIFGQGQSRRVLPTRRHARLAHAPLESSTKQKSIQDLSDAWHHPEVLDVRRRVSSMLHAFYLQQVELSVPDHCARFIDAFGLPLSLSTWRTFESTTTLCMVRYSKPFPIPYGPPPPPYWLPQTSLRSCQEIETRTVAVHIPHPLDYLSDAISSPDLQSALSFFDERVELRSVGILLPDIHHDPHFSTDLDGHDDCDAFAEETSLLSGGIGLGIQCETVNPLPYRCNPIQPISGHVNGDLLTVASRLEPCLTFPNCLAHSESCLPLSHSYKDSTEVQPLGAREKTDMTSSSFVEHLIAFERISCSSRSNSSSELESASDTSSPPLPTPKDSLFQFEFCQGPQLSPGTMQTSCVRLSESHRDLGSEGLRLDAKSPLNSESAAGLSCSFSEEPELRNMGSWTSGLVIEQGNSIFGRRD
ncbi:hypothetical protein EW146_g4967 [Bondarzewia mesenterica]|uniref:Uncharacterized protein n=1 Tax=Bondarzewia mesenterica TaxID=1095465 RepID=A0A4S4LSX4_9AGAM|nr:hypothetical protein EW146_g4967 [Bondarzewia mesenterica]